MKKTKLRELLASRKAPKAVVEPKVVQKNSTKNKAKKKKEDK